MFSEKKENACVYLEGRWEAGAEALEQNEEEKARLA
jgi:hypothetical protein